MNKTKSNKKKSCRQVITHESENWMRHSDRKIKRTHSQLARLLDKPGRKLLLRIADMEDELRDEACLNSFMSGFRLAQGIQQELLADQPPYCEQKGHLPLCRMLERKMLFADEHPQELRRKTKNKPWLGSKPN